MTDRNQIFSETELGRLCELTDVGASCAAEAFGTILGCEVVASPPRVQRVAGYVADRRVATAVIFEADGELSGLIALLLPAESRDALGALLLGMERPEPQVMEPALRELGNIIASQTISAIADTLGGRILLSVPDLVLENAGEALASLIAERGVETCIENELSDAAGDLHAMLLFIPDAKP